MKELPRELHSIAYTEVSKEGELMLCLHLQAHRENASPELLDLPPIALTLQRALEIAEAIQIRVQAMRSRHP